MDTMDRSDELLLPDEPHSPFSARRGSERETTKLGAFVVVLTLAAGTSSVLSGYETAVTSAALVSIGSSLSGRALTPLDKSLITSSTALCALVASPLASLLADRVGRKRVMLYADVLFIVGSLFQASSSTVAHAIAGRCIIGMATGLSSVAVPLYVAEMAPASHRGKLITTTILLVTMGQVLGFMIAGLFAAWGLPEAGWRWTVALGAVPATIQGLMVIFLMPDSPRWLVMVGNLAAAKRVLRRIHGDDDDNINDHGDGDGNATGRTEILMRRIQTEARELREARLLRQNQHSRPGSMYQWLGPWRELLDEHRHRRALAIACLLQALQQLCGFNSLMYFSTTIFMMVGFQTPRLASLVIASINFLFTIISLRLIDKVGRRRMLLSFTPLMVLGLLSAAVGFSFLPLGALSEVPESTDGRGFAAGLVFLSIIVYVASFALGLGNVPSMQSELYPLAVRSLGTGVATSVSWTGNFVMGLTFLQLMSALSPSWTFALYAAICSIGYYLVYRLYPEMAGLGLEEAAALLDHGWAIR